MANQSLLDGIFVFVAVADATAFTGAARQLGCSTSHISKTIDRLEKRLGLRLFNRTTRSITLTDAGRTYYSRCKQIVIDAEDAERAIGELQETPRGVLRASVPVSFGLSHLREALPEFLRIYPEIQLDVEFTERMVDIVEEGFDVVVRVGELKDSNLVARQFAESRGVVVASPDYLAKHGTPTTPEDLRTHYCITFSLISSPSHWEFPDTSGKSAGINVPTRVVCNSAELELSTALAGVGITRLPLFCCEREIADGKLLTLLEDYQHGVFGIYAVYPHRQYLSAKVRVFVDFLIDYFAR